MSTRATASRTNSPVPHPALPPALAILAAAALIVAGTAVSMTGIAAFFGLLLVLFGVLVLVATPYLSRLDPARARPWCSTEACERRPGPTICPECARTIIVGPEENGKD